MPLTLLPAPPPWNQKAIYISEYACQGCRKVEKFGGPISNLVDLVPLPGWNRVN